MNLQLAQRKRRLVYSSKREQHKKNRNYMTVQVFDLFIHGQVLK